MPTVLSKMSQQRPTTERVRYVKPQGCLTLCDKYSHDFGCPSFKHLYSFKEIEQNFNLLQTKFSSNADPSQYRRPPGTPAVNSTPTAIETEVELDFGVLHEAIMRTCGNILPLMNEEATAALILMSMGGRTDPAYKPNTVDILYHEYGCRDELTPGASNEEIHEDMVLFHEALIGQREDPVIDTGDGVVRCDAFGLPNEEMKRQHDGRVVEESGAGRYK